MRRVAKKRPVEVVWKLFSLAVVNHGRDYNVEAHAKGFKLERTLLAARRLAGNDAVERLYMRFGEAHHGLKEDLNDEAIVARCLREAELPESLYREALADPSTEADLLAEHEDSVKRLNAFGVPTLALEGSSLAMYGPVIEPIPEGDEELNLWDHALWSLQSPYLWEFKRERKMKLGPQHVLD